MKQVIKQYFEELKDALDRFPLEDLEKVIAAFQKAYEQDRTIFVIGNGGSAANASHFQADVNKNAISEGRRPRVLALTDNVGSITAWGNDTEYANVFVEQLKNFYREGDTVIAISGSGSSPNIIKAVRWAKENGATVLGLTGAQGAMLNELSDVCVMVPTRTMEQIEDFHSICFHTLVVAMKWAYKKPAVG